MEGETEILFEETTVGRQWFWFGLSRCVCLVTLCSLQNTTRTAALSMLFG